MAVEARRESEEGTFGDISPLTLTVLREELAKLYGTLVEDATMGHVQRVFICDSFIDELGKCINLSVEEYPSDMDCYIQVFDGLQDVINLMHGVQDGLNDANGSPRLMDPQEACLAASDRLTEITEFLAFEISQREVIKEKERMEARKARTPKKTSEVLE